MKPLRFTADLRIAFIYAAFGGLWILLSDSLLAAFVTDPETITRIQTYKGWGFVAASALLIFLLLRHELKLRNNTEDELVESRNLYHTAFDDLLEGVQVIDHDWRYVYVNEAAARQGRSARAALTGRTMMEAYPGIENTEWFAILRDSMANRVVRHAENEFVFPDGSRGWFNLSIQPVPEGVLILSFDITESTRALKALSESQSRLAGMIENAMDAIISLDEDQRIILFNPAAERMFGCPAAKALGQPLDLFIPQRYREAHRGHIRAFGDTRQTGRLLENLPTLVGLRADNTEFPVNATISQVELEGRKLFTAIVRDVTENQHVIEALRQAEEKYRGIFENAMDGIFQSTPEGRFLAVNPAFARMLGYATPEELIETVTDIGSQIYVDSQRRAEFSQLIMERGSLSGFEFEMLRKDGGRIWVTENARAVRDESGVIQFFEGTTEDITARKQAEEEIRRRAGEFSALYETARDLAARHEPSSLLNAIVERARALLDVPASGIYLYDPKRGDLEMSLTIGMPVPVGARLKLGEGMAGKVAQTRQPLIVDDYAAWEGRSRQYEGIPIKAVVQVPMLFAGELIGVLAVDGDPASDRKFTQNDSHILMLLAEYAASAIHSMRLYGQAQQEIAERKQAEGALREAERRYRTLVEQLPNVVTYIDSADPEVGTLYVSPQIEEMLGFKPEEWQSDPRMWHNQIFLEDRERILAEDKRHDETGETLTCEYRLSAKGGRVVWVYDEAVMLCDETGKPLYSHGIMIDITERKLAEVALRESERRYRALFEQSHDAMFILDMQGNHLVANQRAADMLGYTPEELIGLSFRSISAETTQSENILKRLLGGEQIPLYERIFRKKNGDLIPVEINVELIRDMYGNPLHIQSAVRDISERKRAEQALRGSEEKLRLFVEHVPVVLAMLDRDMRYIAVSRRLITDYNLEETDITGRSHYEVFPDIPERWKEIHQRGLAGEVIRSEEDEFIRMDGSVQWLRWEVLPWYTADDKIGGIVIFTEEISERKRAVTELRRYAQNTAAMYELSQQMLTSSNLEQIYTSAHQAVKKMMPCDSFVVALLDKKTQEIEDSYLWDHDKRWPPARHPISQAQLTTYIISSATPLLVNRWDESHDRMTGAAVFGYTEQDTLSVLAVPLFHTSGECFGMISTQAYLPDAYTEEHLQLLATVASQISETIENVRLVSDLQKSNMELFLAYDATIEGWSHAMDLRDKETEGHTQRVTGLTLELARQMGVSEPEIVQIRRGALLHDIGKLGVPDIILLKSDMLTDEEWEVMRKHPQFAYEMLAGIDYLKDALDIPLCHHERWDGKGYPRGLKGEEIPLAARIFAVVDVWDAITTDRPYRLGWSKEAAIQHIRSESGRHFDPVVVENFLALILHVE